MRARGRLTVGVSCLIAALLPLSPVAAGTADQGRGGPTPSVTWTPCAEDPTADCGTLADFTALVAFNHGCA
ncbi:hypothetical protein [Microbispora sitophila]|uniref:hypothetical protein n=1 Tax=Microbispora sitophila TaxID=2771537 RepID=UPI001D013B68|nr:hypothetical protein [Microbispora sitophila]